MLLLNRFKENKGFWILIFLLVFVRIAYLFVMHPPLNWIDSSAYDGGAVNFLQGKGYFLDGNAYGGREPGYSLLFLAPLYFIFGHKILIVQIFQILLSLITGLIIFSLSKKYFSKKVGLLALVIFSFYPPFIAYTGEVMTEIPFTFLLFLSVYLIDKAFYQKSFSLMALSGIVLGFATLTRFIAVFLPFLFFVYFYLQKIGVKKALKYFAVLLFFSWLCVFPWILRNYIVFDSFIFGRLGGGSMYWSGSSVLWDGEWKGYSYPMIEIVGQGELATVKADKIFIKLAIENIKEYPLDVLAIWFKKPAKIFFKSEFNTILDRDNGFAKLLGGRQSVGPFIVKWVLLGINIILVMFAFLGAFIESKNRKSYQAILLFLLLFFYFCFFYLPMNPDSRYKLPVLPYLIILASCFLIFLTEKTKDFIFKKKIIQL